MKIGPLYIMDGNALLAWHYDWSITWSWIITLHWHRRAHTLGFHRIGDPGNWRMAVWNNWIFDLCYQCQPTLARDWPFSGRGSHNPPKQ